VVARFRWSVLVFVAVAFILASCGGPAPAKSGEASPTGSTSTTTVPPTLATTTTTAVPASEASCNSAQLQIEYRGSQGATGNWASAFWIANRSSVPCAIRGSVTVDLIDRSGGERSASSPLLAPIPLSASASLPTTSASNGPAGQQLGALVLFWPTLPNAIEELTGTDGPNSQCPQPLFTPVSARITFSGDQPLIVSPLSGDGPIPGMGSLCGNFVRIEEAGSLN
jgi:hypothetical protein